MRSSESNAFCHRMRSLVLLAATLILDLLPRLMMKLNPNQRTLVVYYQGHQTWKPRQLMY
ncbi:hypothetical protein ACS8FB_06070 [Psychrobacter sp. 1U1]|uniref:hypothetical protein n=1 Tax=Psychrobacter sp. 1U1 TaxID=3453576 RepID=UPI003F453395